MPVPQVGLISYVFYINRRGRRLAYVNLNSFGDGYSLRTIIIKFLETLHDAPLFDDEGTKKTWQLHDYEYDGGHIEGTILSGLYGDRMPIVNRVTHALSYQKLEDDAEIRSYHFYIETPTSDIGEYVASFQAYDYHGVKAEFETRLKLFFANYEDLDLSERYTLHMRPIVPSSYINQIAERVKIKKVVFKKYGERMGMISNSDTKTDADIEISVNATRRTSLPLNERFIEYINGSRNDIKGVFLLPKELEGLEYTDVKLDVIDNGKHKTINLRKLDLPKFSYYVDQSTLLKDENGYIIPESLSGSAEDLVSLLRNDMSPRGPVSEDEIDQE